MPISDTTLVFKCMLMDGKRREIGERDGEREATIGKGQPCVSMRVGSYWWRSWHELNDGERCVEGICTL